MADTVSFTKGFVYRKDRLYLVAVSDELDEKDIYHAIMLRYKDQGWAHWTVEDRIVGLCVFDGPAGVTVLAMGIDGRIQIGDNTGFRWEVVDTGDEAPSILRHLTAIRTIGRHVYVAGMARQVYRRPLAGGPWERADRGALVPRKSAEIAGFKSIDGLVEDDLYAAGFHGQIWHFNGARWTSLDSPTNILLAAVKCMTPDLVYIGGGKGTVLKGNKDSWEVVPNEVTQETFWAVENYKGTLYLATTAGTLFKLEQGSVVPVETGLDKEITTNWLHANDGVLMSVGARDLLVFDGSAWTEIPHP
jgi:hypothetical protein